MKSTVLYNRNEVEGVGLSAAEQCLLKVLAYFDIFHYPLTKEELRLFAGEELEESAIENAISDLLQAKLIFSHLGYYSLENNPLLVHRRNEGNKRASELLVKANRIGRFLYRFPFVRAVGVSGSLSKNFAEEKADIDFFIITKTNRLWIARTLMHCYKKLTYITGRQHYYCMNYYLDESAMELKDENIFTAIELKTILPVTGSKTMSNFFEANKWADKWLPVCGFRSQLKKDKRFFLLKNIFEWILDNKLGNWISIQLMKITTRRWKQKEAKGVRNEKGLTMGLITDRHFCFSNPGAFKQKVLATYNQKLRVLNIHE